MLLCMRRKKACAKYCHKKDVFFLNSGLFNRHADVIIGELGVTSPTCSTQQILFFFVGFFLRVLQWNVF